MKNHEFMGGETRDQIDDVANIHTNNEINPAKFNVADYEKALLEDMNASTMGYAERQMEQVLANLTWRGSGGSPKERYDGYDDDEFRANVDRYRLFNEAEALCGYNRRKDGENIPKSMFLRYLADRIEENPVPSFPPDMTIPLTESETEHFHKSANNVTQYLSNENSREQSFAHYLVSLVKMCRGVYGNNSRAEMYLCDDLNQMLSSQENKSKIIDKLIERKLDAAQKIATESSPSERIGFTGALDLPKGIENRSVRELVEEGVPSLYGYDEQN